MLMADVEQDFKAIWEARAGERQVGHAHFWDRALSRRQVLGSAAGAAGVALGLPAIAAATRRKEMAMPRPIPGGTQIDDLGFFHFNFPTSPNPAGARDTIDSTRGDPSTITDFNGFIGVGEWGGGTGKDQSGTTLYWAADLRFMDGEYIGLDGRHHGGAFVFV